MAAVAAAVWLPGPLVPPGWQALSHLPAQLLCNLQPLLLVQLCNAARSKPLWASDEQK